MTFLSRNYTRERTSSFLLQWLSRGAARVSGVCFALFSSATDARERFPCEEQWPALKCKSPQRPRCFGKQNPRAGFAGTSRLECTRMRKTRPVEVTNTSISAINLFLICLLTLSWKNKYLYHKKGLPLGATMWSFTQTRGMSRISMRTLSSCLESPFLSLSSLLSCATYLAVFFAKFSLVRKKVR